MRHNLAMFDPDLSISIDVDFIRMIGLVLLAIASGAIVRFFLSVVYPKRWFAFLAVCAATLVMAGTVIYKISEDPESSMQWWVTPPVYAYSILVLITLSKYLTFKRVEK